MSHARRRPVPTPIAALTVLSLSLALAACGGAGAAETTSEAATTAPSTPPTIAPISASTSASTATPAHSDVVDTAFSSAAYGYDALIPGELGPVVWIAAQRPWDGAESIGSTGPATDRVALPGSRLLFVYGAPTDLDLAAYAAAGQRLKAGWHGCPAAPESATDATFAGSPAILHVFPCGGLRVLSLFTVHDGFGLVVNMLNPPGHLAEDRAIFLDLIADWAWIAG